jgi:hypothetical protein
MILSLDGIWVYLTVWETENFPREEGYGTWDSGIVRWVRWKGWHRDGVPTFV